MKIDICEPYHNFCVFAYDSKKKIGGGLSPPGGIIALSNRLVHQALNLEQDFRQGLQQIAK